MKNKTFKRVGLLLVAVMCFFVGTKTTHAITTQQFTYDYEFNIKMPDKLIPGQDNDIILSDVSTNSHNSGVQLQDITLSWKMTEITKERYLEFKAIQDKIDQKTKAESDDADIKQFEDLINKKYSKDQYWCWNDPVVGKITLTDDFCDVKYFIVTVDALDSKVKLNGEFDWNYKVARVYEVKGSRTDCDPKPSPNPKCKEEKGKYYGPNGEEITKAEYTKLCPAPNPKTGITAPYIICAAVALGAVIVIVVSQKKKFI